MGDHVDLQIDPETPGRPSIRNPFESPNDYHRLHEPLVPSPSVFKSKATPAKFNWSIDEMASLLPANIDPEEIQRQSFYLSQTRMDSDMEEKYQRAIEQFFTKGAIVPSPWAAPDTRRVPQIFKKEIPEKQEKISVACQTTLSLPLAFDLEKLLGEYYSSQEQCDAVQENLSSSSLRRKLFLDGNSNSGSDSSSPPSPERSHCTLEVYSQEGVRRNSGGAELTAGGGEAMTPMFASPVSCGVSAPTPSTGQFSSSPIQHGRFRDCSLGSISSPFVPNGSSPAGFASPTISPIFAHTARTPMSSAERRQPSHLTPHSVCLDVGVTACSESPFVEGCSPIRSCSPHHLCCNSELHHLLKNQVRVRCWASPPLISPILNPKLQDHHEFDDNHPSSSSSLLSIELDTLSPVVKDTNLVDAEKLRTGPDDPVKMQEGKDTGLEVELEDEEEEGRRLSEQLTSSRMVSMSTTESSHMFVSLLAEGSSIRYESSMQVDSGYNTTSAGITSLTDGLSSHCHSKESFSTNLTEEAHSLTRHTKKKVFHPHHSSLCAFKNGNLPL
ncbi:protein aurora borealis [Cynoglossus semilaevis]|uniref:Protein aurora borealis n=1 Tax=Cynoglossus semilaevis TaxID=244447 RepID=A0A3P8UQK6_CYNSE|nr:protein aurora borealis [Cynoglossus semilaevis]XP_008319772.1 protein aurora borealis [Cynoglossus semilaevis]